MNLQNAKIKLSVDRSSANLICNASETEQVNIVPYRLEIARFDLVFLQNETMAKNN